jgi:hypothetical protein
LRTVPGVADVNSLGGQFVRLKCCRTPFAWLPMVSACSNWPTR